MRGLPFVFLATMSFSSVSAAECPAASTEAVLSALRNARSCRGAAQTYRICTRATTQDLQFADVVVGKCESGFLARLKPKQRASYGRQMSRCERKYARQTGTLYRCAPVRSGPLEHLLSGELIRLNWRRAVCLKITAVQSRSAPRLEEEQHEQENRCFPSWPCHSRPRSRGGGTASVAASDRVRFRRFRIVDGLAGNPADPPRPRRRGEPGEEARAVHGDDVPVGSRGEGRRAVASGDQMRPDARAITHAPIAPLWREDQKRKHVPVASDAEREMPDARRASPGER
jgi:hypothetical protein